MLAVVLLTEIVATVLIPVWREYFYNGIEAKSWDVFITGIWYYIALVGTFGLMQGFKYFIGHRLSFTFRRGLTLLLENKWKKNLNVKADFDNPDQRIQEDTQIATELASEVLVEVIISVSIVVGLVWQMWGNNLLFGLALGYTLLAAAIAALFHRKMVDSEKDYRRAEADYRFTLASTSMKAKWNPTETVFENVKTQYMYMTKVLMGFSIFSRLKSSFMTLVPLLVLVPMYFAGDIKFGEIMKGVAQFDLIVINATILIILYPKITKILAGYERIKEFYCGLDEEITGQDSK